jgi:hypothetical protein
MGAMPTSPLERTAVTPTSVLTGQGGVRAAGFAVLEVAAPVPGDLTVYNEQDWTVGS